MTYNPRRGDRDFYIYLVLSETPTRFGGLIRRCAKIQYNHASIAFDENLKSLYSFGRHQHKNPLNAGLVREYPERFTLNRHIRVNIRIYRIPVTKMQYIMGKRRILEIRHDPEGYLYNLWSVLTYPVLKGFYTYKAYSCAEFTAHLLYHMGVLGEAEKYCYAFTPEALGALFKDRLFFEGNLLDYWINAPTVRHNFFGNPGYTVTAKTSCVLPVMLLYRKIRHRNIIVAKGRFHWFKALRA